MKNTKRLNYILIGFFIFSFLFPLNAQISKDEIKEKSMDEMWGQEISSSTVLLSERAKLFDQSNFGMFIHWGLFSNLGGKWKDKTYYGIGEWIMNPRMANIPPQEYMKTASSFNPTEFDAKKIAQLAKDAGMKYIIITSKHHEGFAMFDSKVSSFDIVDATPFGRDPMKELAKACDELGLGFGFYYSHNQDWTAPGGTRGPKVDNEGKTASFEDYFYSKCLPQVKEICTNYGEIDFVWFDTPGDMDKKLVVELVDVVRTLQPKAMLCSRVGHGLGDYSSKGDMEVPLLNMPGLWETCDTNNDSWSYAWYDNNFKSPKEILKRLISTVARGGTYLFNVGPNNKGAIPEIGASFLEDVGNWIGKYPDVIYNAGSSPWGFALPWGDVTTQGNNLYLSIFDLPSDGLIHLPKLSNKIKSAQLLTDGKQITLETDKNKNWTTIKFPPIYSKELVSVVKLVLEGEEVKVEKTLALYPNMPTKMHIDHASKVDNAEQKSIRWMEKFGEWKHVNQVSNWQENGSVEWEVDVKTPGLYYVLLNYKGNGRLVWNVSTSENEMIQNQQAATEKYATYPIGIIEFKKSGKKTISVSLVDGNKYNSSLNSITLKPI